MVYKKVDWTRPDALAYLQKNERKEAERRARKALRDKKAMCFKQFYEGN